MAQGQVSRLIWLIETVRRYGRITRSQLDECWAKSSLGDGKPLSRRTLYNYRQAVANVFNIDIECDPVTFEYYIAQTDDHSSRVADWILNSMATSDVLNQSHDVASKIFLEDVPSAREFLAPVVEALRDKHPVRFSYQSYTRSKPSNVVLEPYFLKIFRQRWYLTGRNTSDSKVKTYALDRIRGLHVLPEEFAPDPSFDAEAYVRDSFGIVFNQSEARRVVLRAEPHTAKYLRDLPLHHSQDEMLTDAYSVFQYHMRLTPDLVQEILYLGPGITVLEPAELRLMVKDELQRTLNNYNS